MTSRVTGPTRRSRTSLDRDVDQRAARRRRSLLFRRGIHVNVSEADVLVWLFGLLSIVYCCLTIVVELLRMLG